MTPGRYEELLHRPQDILAIKYEFGHAASRDYVNNSDIPSTIFCEEDAINVINYYYFWFPLVKDHI